MSHITKVECKFNDANILKEACKQLGVPCSFVKDFKFVGSVGIDGKTSFTGYQLELKGWNFPVMVLADGSAVYDNYNGAWGKDEEFDKVKQRYSIESVKSVAAKKGIVLKENTLESGEVQLVAVM